MGTIEVPVTYWDGTLNVLYFSHAKVHEMMLEIDDLFTDGTITEFSINVKAQ